MYENEKHISKYFDVLEKYFLFIENKDDSLNINLLNSMKNNLFLNLVGFRIISNVFQINIHKNSDLEDIFFKSKKAFYIYLEYLEQIVNKENFIELNQSDLILFVYSKTIDHFQSFDVSNNETSIQTEKNQNTILDISKIIEPLLWFDNPNINNRVKIVGLLRGFFPLLMENKYLSLYFYKVHIIDKEREHVMNNYYEYLSNFIQKVKKIKYTDTEWQDLILET